MRTRTVWLSRIVVGLAVLLTVAATAAPAAATSFFTNVTLEAYGADAGGEPRVKVYQPATIEVANFLAFGPGFTGGVRVAVGDIDGDGRDDVVVGAGPGGGPHVQVFRGVFCAPPGPTCPTGVTVDPTPAASFFAFDPAFTGGVYVAVGNFDPSNDPSGVGACKRHEIVVAAGQGGGPHVQIFRNATTGGVGCPGGAINLGLGNPIESFLAFPTGFTGGVRVAAGDLNNDQLADLVVGAGPGGGPHVMAFPNVSASASPGSAYGHLNLAAPVANFFAFPSAFTGGVYVGLQGNPVRRNIVVGAGAGGGPQVVVIQNTGLGTGYGFNQTTPLASFFAFDPSFTGGVRVGHPSIFFPSNLVLLTTGVGGFVKTMAVSPPNVLGVDFPRGLVPFLPQLGVFPSQ